MEYVQRQLDQRAIVAGAVVQAVLMAAMYFEYGPIVSTTAGSVGCGVVTGAISRTFEGEWLDGLLGAGVGVLLGIALIGLNFWVTTAGFSSTVRENLLIGFGGWAVFGAIMFAPLVCVVGGIFAHLSAQAAFVVRHA